MDQKTQPRGSVTLAEGWGVCGGTGLAGGGGRGDPGGAPLASLAKNPPTSALPPEGAALALPPAPASVGEGRCGRDRAGGDERGDETERETHGDPPWRESDGSDEAPAG